MAKTAPLAAEVASSPLPPFNLAGSLLIAAMVSALVALCTSMLARFVPGWRPGLLSATCLVVALEAALVRYRMQSGRHLEVGALGYLAAELFLLAVVMRVVATVSSLAPLGELARWARAPLDALDLSFAGYFLLGIAVALLVRGGLRLLAVLEPRGAPIVEQGLDADFFRAEQALQERAALTQITSGIGWGAVLVLFALAGHLLPIGGENSAPRLPAGIALAGIIYMVCGVLLYSRARLGLLRATWRRDGAAVEPAVPRRWHTASVSLVVAVAVAGLMLPRGLGVELVASAQGGLLLLVNLVTLLALFFGAVAMGAIGLALTIPALILALLIGSGGTAPLPTGPFTPPVQPPAPVAATSPPIAPGIVFWICIGALAVYALATVLRRQEWAIALVRRLRSGAFGRLLDWLGHFWSGVAHYAHSMGDAVAARLARPEPQPQRSHRGPRRPRGPGALVRMMYLAILRLAERGGLGRRRNETPFEYRSTLRTQLPDAADDVDTLTDAYVAAAYAPREPSNDDARRARASWSRVRRAMRGRGRGNNPGN